MRRLLLSFVSGFLFVYTSIFYANFVFEEQPTACLFEDRALTYGETVMWTKALAAWVVVLVSLTWGFGFAVFLMWIVNLLSPENNKDEDDDDVEDDDFLLRKPSSSYANSIVIGVPTNNSGEYTAL